MSATVEVDDPVYIEVENFVSDKGVGQYRIDCQSTECRSRKKKKQKSLSVSVTAESTVFNCWHCGLTGVLRTNVVPISRPPRKLAAPAKSLHTSPLTPQAIEFLNARGIGQVVAELYGVSSMGKYIASEEKEVPCISFPYIRDGDVYASKIRAIGTKGFSQNGAAETFWGIDHFISGDDLVIVEGELDVLACVEAGINAVSVPNGAPLKISEDAKIDPSEDGKFRYVWAAKEQIDSAARIIIAVDNDTPGSALSEELARRIGKQRCWLVSWDGKDANDVLLTHGAEVLREAIDGAEAWPVAGLYEASAFAEEVDTLYDRGIGRGALTGFPQFDEIYTVMPGQLTVVTGVPSSGKSEFIDQLMTNLAEAYQWKFAVASFENEPRLHLAKLLSKRVRKPFFLGPTTRMTVEEKTEAMGWVGKHFHFIYQADGAMARMDSILERASVAVMRYGCRGLVVDPYNYIEREGDNEHQHISDMLTKLSIWAKAHDVHVWFVAHPNKLTRDIKVPKGYEISGSASWFSKCDAGLTVHRSDPVNDPRAVEVHCWKMRFSWVGKQGISHLQYDPATTRYHEDYQDPNWDTKPVLGNDPFL